MARRTQHNTPETGGNFVDYKTPGVADGQKVTEGGNSGYGFERSAASTEQIYRELDGARILNGDVAWLLNVWGIHQVGAERWIQMSVSAESIHHDLVLHLGRAASVHDAVMTVETWLGSPFPTSRIIHVV